MSLLNHFAYTGEDYLPGVPEEDYLDPDQLANSAQNVVNPEPAYLPGVDFSASDYPGWHAKGVGFHGGSSSDSSSMDQYQYASWLIDQMNKQAQTQTDAAQASAERAMQFSAEQAQLNRDFQERMSSTAYQRVVQDLKAAGLNPALAYGQGASSSPSGSAASGNAAQIALANSYDQNISESETLSKRERDSKLWSSLISGMFSSAGSFMHLAGLLALAK